MPQLWRDGRVWFNAPALKSGDGDKPSLGSNPNPAAMKPVGFGGFLEGFSNNKKDAVATTIVWQHFSMALCIELLTE